MIHDGPKSTPNPLVGTQNPPKWNPKLLKLDAKESLAGVLGPSWPQDGPKSHIYPKPNKVGPPVGSQNPTKNGLEAIQNVIIFLIDFWIDLVPTWTQLAPKSFPKWSQVGFQKPSKRQSSKTTKIFKNQCLYMFLEGSRVPSWSQNQPKIASKRYLKQDKNLNGFWMALGSILG